MNQALLTPFIRSEHTSRSNVLQRFWIGALLLQLGLIGLITAAVPKYATGESPLSIGLALACTLLVAVAFFLVERWERTRLARVAVDIVESNDPSIDESRAYAFADPRGALLGALDAVLAPTLLRLVLVSGISFVSWNLRLNGTSLAFSLALVAISLFIQWRIFPSIESTAKKLEEIKGVCFTPLGTRRLLPTMQLGPVPER